MVSPLSLGNIVPIIMMWLSLFAVPLSAADEPGNETLQFHLSIRNQPKGGGGLPIIDVIILNSGKNDVSVSFAMATVPTFALFDLRSGVRLPLHPDAPLITYVNEVVMVPHGSYVVKSMHISDLHRFYRRLPEVVRIGLLFDGRNNASWAKYDQGQPWVQVADTLLQIPPALD